MSSNRFQDLFKEDGYITLKNHLYNYQLRRRAVERILAGEPHKRVLEIGAGTSPVMTQTDRIVYSELSFMACRTLKRSMGRGDFVAADATRLPFRDGVFSHTVSSEVFEHIPDDRAAVGELARVTAPGGRMIVTFPHRRSWFANDDRYIQHCRRYDLADMVALLEEACVTPVKIEKILGPLEKLFWMLWVFCFKCLQALLPNRKKNLSAPPGGLIRLITPLFILANRLFAGIAWIDARLVPQAFASVLLVVAEKKNERA